ncbi:MAG: p-hydroxycinnamoyl CoA hydratase/lyase [Gammaproteobacteria bacterium RIFCSPLOWO2_02_FULL_56_15]|nr:MAG: p-hydroxycinnamoyl CoA hydratase/lyase [Gammaproteobacteria bacterium RIFCSPLOWO2_02_FULL_56_15]
MATENTPWGRNVLVEFEDRIAWVMFNRPEKRNCMSPALNQEMLATLEALETDDRCGVLVLTGVGEAWSAGMDLREYFAEMENASDIVKYKTQRAAGDWQWRKLRDYYKPTIAMVNGWCFGGAFTPLVACDLAIASEDAVFGLSEINWGILPAGNVSKMVADTMGLRDGLYYIMTGETFDGRKAAEMKLINEAVPAEKLKERVTELARILLAKNQTTLRCAKEVYKRISSMDWDTASDYIYAKVAEAMFKGGNKFKQKAMKAFLEEKTFRPGLETFREKED